MYASGVDAVALEEADDEEDVKEAVILLIIQCEEAARVDARAALAEQLRQLRAMKLSALKKRAVQSGVPTILPRRKCNGSEQDLRDLRVRLELPCTPYYRL